MLKDCTHIWQKSVLTCYLMLDDLDKDDETAEGQGNEKINYSFTRQI
jgi:hypothetical protein